MAGRLTRDPKVTFLPSQTAVCDFGLAASKKSKSQDGTIKEKTCFIDCRIFGKRADVINKHFKKGDPIFIEGELDFQTWEKEGQKRSKHSLLMTDFQFIASKKSTDAPEEQNDSVPPLAQNHPVFNPDDNDEIPF
jgi:single-strand DNA-binding protein